MTRADKTLIVLEAYGAYLRHVVETTTDRAKSVMVFWPARCPEAPFCFEQPCGLRGIMAQMSVNEKR